MSRTSSADLRKCIRFGCTQYLVKASRTNQSQTSTSLINSFVSARACYQRSPQISLQEWQAYCGMVYITFMQNSLPALVGVFCHRHQNGYRIRKSPRDTKGSDGKEASSYRRADSTKRDSKVPSNITVSDLICFMAVLPAFLHQLVAKNAFPSSPFSLCHQTEKRKERRKVLAKTTSCLFVPVPRINQMLNRTCCEPCWVLLPMWVEGATLKSSCDAGRRF